MVLTLENSQVHHTIPMMRICDLQRIPTLLIGFVVEPFFFFFFTEGLYLIFVCTIA